MKQSFIDPQCVSVYIVHSNNYLLIRRSGPYLKNTWQMVSGKIESGEKAYEAALREVFEETGLIPDKLYSADAVETFYMASIDKVTFVPVFVGFIDELRQVKLSPREHDAYEWLIFEDAKERLLFAEQKRIISQIHENFVLKTPDRFFLIEKRTNSIEV